MTLRYGLIGLGSMGRHHARNIRALAGAELVAVADPYGDKFGVAGDLEVLPDVDALIDAGIDAAMVAVPTGQHAEVALKLAAAGIHTMVEKPLASTIEEGKALVAAFEDAGLVGAVGYVERCNPALLEMRRRIAEGQLGKVYQITTRRQSPFPARIADVGVVKDLATHDVDLTAWVAGSQYAVISAQTAHRADREYEDLVTASGKLANGVLVNHLVNWLTPYKERQTVVLGEHGALVADTTMGDLTFYENGSLPLGWDQISAFRGVSEGQVIRYALEKREPLAVEHEHFRDAVLGKACEHVTMREALTTMEVVQAMLDSAAHDGEVVRF
ncbi:Gfo/Idh/MocA family protein [Trueperella pyogenes]|uniref:Gfo/Idh/MocA family protein n=1 Tax=Trueperella pyogenes TaxID=1661 RepID=UPI00057E2028|nr:Gfo/Idh/MocA family oxidoreductase [Trueperella pyogenes]AJC69140.1 dehydrogenase [Trueperella pyogenes TP8]MDF2419935.1 Gfo/Idh/MocA family oxidoreductase [Trueperella pyogenes]PIN52281.1 gfo/Idh/MocA family oxidoreductase [Trueperella pyogenes]QIU86834.1 Gfo/Idh/MocA family oxidoreductase [Trueperella pyogenes]WHU61959.1 Gfo/Idh/MocA family oxidoreductase [Trueperella pyogenes]